MPTVRYRYRIGTNRVMAAAPVKHRHISYIIDGLLLTLAATVAYSLIDKKAMGLLDAGAWSSPLPRSVAFYYLLNLQEGVPKDCYQATEEIVGEVEESSQEAQTAESDDPTQDFLARARALRLRGVLSGVLRS